jgi:hypothetical protein
MLDAVICGDVTDVVIVHVIILDVYIWEVNIVDARMLDVCITGANMVDARMLDVCRLFVYV